MGRPHPEKMNKVRERDVVQDYAERHPFCEVCLHYGKETTAAEIHHLIQGAGRSDEDCNLLSTCERHHRFAHSHKGTAFAEYLYIKHCSIHRRHEVLAGYNIPFPWSHDDGDR